MENPTAQELQLIKQLAVLPSGRHTEALRQAVDKTIERFGIVPYFLPKDKHTAMEKAEAIYEVLTAKDANGAYKYKYLRLGGGNGSEDVIDELEKLIKIKGPIPQRSDINIISFSDGSQFLHYFGQRGIGNQFYYSAGYNLDVLKQLENAQKNGLSFSENDLDVLNNPHHVTQISGHTQPGSITSIANRPTHQLQVFDKGTNVLAIEPSTDKEVERLGTVLNQIKDKDITLLLSKDTTEDMKKRIVTQFPDCLILSGGRFGHGQQRKDGQLFPLMAKCDIKITNKKASMSIDSHTDTEKAKELSDPAKNPKRIPDIKQSHLAGTHFYVVASDGAGRGVTSPLELVKRNQSAYTLHIYANKEQMQAYGWQRMCYGIRELLENKLIDPDKLKTVNFRNDTTTADIFKKSNSGEWYKPIQDASRLLSTTSAPNTDIL